jgi:molybdopterin synthase catalytic subunit
MRIPSYSATIAIPESYQKLEFVPILSYTVFIGVLAKVPLHSAWRWGKIRSDLSWTGGRDSMRIQLYLFAGLADRLGGATVTAELPGERATAGDLKRWLAERHPIAASLIEASFVAKNQAYAEDAEPIGEGDELALIPPVSGGGGAVGGGDAAEAWAVAEQRYEVTYDPLDVEAVTRKVICPQHGATLAFCGTTREFTEGKRTTLLEYEGYVPMAVKTLAQIGAEIADRWPGALTAITHRLGRVEIGEISVVIAVSTPRRTDCYEASRYAIERLKQIVPIWKKEVWEDGSEWQGSQLGPWDPTASPKTS